MRNKQLKDEIEKTKHLIKQREATQQAKQIQDSKLQELKSENESLEKELKILMESLN